MTIIEDLKLQLEKTAKEKEQYQQKNIQLQQDAKNAEERMNLAEQKSKYEENLRREVEKKLDYVISQNNFLQKDISDDTKNLESILHHIELNTPLIKTDIENLVKAINNNEPKEKLIDIIKRISNLNEKINSFSKYFKKVNFESDSNSLDVDIISFTNEYIENVYKLREDLKTNRELLNVKINVPANLEYKLKINPIDVIIVLDNLISNSLKNNATDIILSWIKRDDGVLLSFKDNGSGIADNIIDYIFDFGFTTSRRGSGIGLYHIKEIIENSYGTITVNNKIVKGVEFIINFRRLR